MDTPANIILAACAVAALCLTVAGATLGFAFAQDRRITRLEERVRGLGLELQRLPKRKEDGEHLHP